MQIDIATEQWASIPGFPGYEASTLGQIRNAKTGRLLRQHRSKWGYLKVAPKGADGCKMKFVHRLVISAFFGAHPEDRPFTNHINGDKTDNRLVNLEFCSASENMRHMHATGLHRGCVGENNSQARLTREDVAEIRRLLSSGLQHKEIAARFGVGRQTITNISTGSCWRHA